jgi:hypothetical protein
MAQRRVTAIRSCGTSGVLSHSGLSRSPLRLRGVTEDQRSRVCSYFCTRLTVSTEVYPPRRATPYSHSEFELRTRPALCTLAAVTSLRSSIRFHRALLFNPVDIGRAYFAKTAASCCSRSQPVRSLPAVAGGGWSNPAFRFGSPPFDLHNSYFF